MAALEEASAGRGAVGRDAGVSAMVAEEVEGAHCFGYWGGVSAVGGVESGEWGLYFCSMFVCVGICRVELVMVEWRVGSAGSSIFLRWSGDGKRREEGEDVCLY